MNYVDPILLIRFLHFYLFYGQFFVLLYFHSLRGETGDEKFIDIFGVNYPLFLGNFFCLFCFSFYSTLEKKCFYTHITW